MEKYKIAVIGAGVSGLMAAYSASKILKEKESREKVVLLEGNKKAGKKLLVTGNGRCNLTNRNITADAYHGDKRGLSSILNAVSTEKLTDLFKEMGLLVTSGDKDKNLLYPKNLQASAVLKILLSSCEQQGVVCKYGFNVFSVVSYEKGFKLKAENGEEIYADKCVIAAGGKASSVHSCGQNGYAVVKQTGHSITELRPSLVSVNTEDKMVKALKGMRTKAKVTLVIGGKDIYSESGEVIFSDLGLSGICIMNASSYIADFYRTGKAETMIKIILDIAEDMSINDIEAYLKAICVKHPGRAQADMLSGIVQMKLGAEIVRSSLGDKYNDLGPISDITEGDIHSIAENIKFLQFTVSGLGDWKSAQITCGGVPLSEISTQTMESKKRSGIYLCGEILDIDGICGGFNLHFAWSTGIIAGEHAAGNVLYV